MHEVVREVSYEDAHRILNYCLHNSIQQGGLFEVYSTPGTDIHMVIVNSCSEDEPLERFRPLGAFYLNYLRPGTISMEQEDPTHDGMPSTRRHVAAIRQVVDILVEKGFPGVTIRFNDLPAVRDVSS